MAKVNLMIETKDGDMALMDVADFVYDHKFLIISMADGDNRSLFIDTEILGSFKTISRRQARDLPKFTYFVDPGDPRYI